MATRKRTTTRRRTATPARRRSTTRVVVANPTRRRRTARKNPNDVLKLILGGIAGAIIGNKVSGMVPGNLPEIAKRAVIVGAGGLTALKFGRKNDVIKGIGAGMAIGSGMQAAISQVPALGDDMQEIEALYNQGYLTEDDLDKAINALSGPVQSLAGPVQSLAGINQMQDEFASSFM